MTVLPELQHQSCLLIVPTMSHRLSQDVSTSPKVLQDGKAGILKPDDRVELIEGEIIKMSPIAAPCSVCSRIR
jgi:hypothetical protein